MVEMVQSDIAFVSEITVLFREVVKLMCCKVNVGMYG